MFGWIEKKHMQWLEKQDIAREARWRKDRLEEAGFWSMVGQRLRERHGLDIKSLRGDEAAAADIRGHISSLNSGIFDSLGDAVDSAADIIAKARKRRSAG